ncbi:reverse transcriptase [Senna tora]|uniref:Reverse transcriptase n=1 Tax=Senna tora TaxID=362788 RepID=A0A834TN82_9FABA|nr:reverse transcriptase [Senna tora]
MDWVGPSSEVAKAYMKEGSSQFPILSDDVAIDIAESCSLGLEKSARAIRSFKKVGPDYKAQGNMDRNYKGVRCGLKASPSRYIIELPSDEEEGGLSAIIPFSRPNIASDMVLSLNRVSLKHDDVDMSPKSFSPGKLPSKIGKKRAKHRLFNVEDDSLVDVPVELEDCFPKDWFRFQARKRSDENSKTEIKGSGGWPAAATQEPIYKPQVVFRMETKRFREKMDELRRRHNFSSTRLFMLIRSKNFIHSSVGSNSIEVPNFLTCVYGPPKERERRLAWDELQAVGRSIRGLWLCVGDFNVILYHLEKWGGMDFIKEKLDQALGNVPLMLSFPKAQAFINDPIGYDHGALVVDLNFCDLKSPKSFKFELSWLDQPDYKDVMREGWYEYEMMIEDFILELIRRLEEWERDLIVWSKKAFTNNRAVIANLSAQLRDCFSEEFTEEMK